jgi:hypothetical protein
MARQVFGEAIASRYWREEDARTLLTAWRASGLSAVEFGRRHGLSARHRQPPTRTKEEGRNS